MYQSKSWILTVLVAAASLHLTIAQPIAVASNSLDVTPASTVATTTLDSAVGPDSGFLAARDVASIDDGAAEDTSLLDAREVMTHHAIDPSYNLRLPKRSGEELENATPEFVRQKLENLASQKARLETSAQRYAAGSRQEKWHTYALGRLGETTQKWQDKLASFQPAAQEPKVVR